MDGARKALLWVLGVGIIGVFLFIFGLMIQSLGDAVPVVGNNTNESVNDTATVDRVAWEALNATTNTANQLPTIGTLVGVMFLVAVAIGIVLVIVVVARRMSSGGR